jgi:hypothetical protein
MNPQFNPSRHCQRHRTGGVSFGNFGTKPLSISFPSRLVVGYLPLSEYGKAVRH